MYFILHSITETCYYSMHFAPKTPNHPLKTQCSSLQSIQSISVHTSTGTGLAVLAFSGLDLKIENLFLLIYKAMSDINGNDRWLETKPSTQRNQET